VWGQKKMVLGLIQKILNAAVSSTSKPSIRAKGIIVILPFNFH
jgi:hypothetical protein